MKIANGQYKDYLFGQLDPSSSEGQALVLNSFFLSSHFSFILFWEKLFGLFALLLLSIILIVYLQRYVNSFKLLRKQKSTHLDRVKFMHFHQHSVILEVILFSVLSDNLTPSHPCHMWQWQEHSHQDVRPLAAKELFKIPNYKTTSSSA